jgi:membrane protein DedA with SNARE-associated domain
VIGQDILNVFGSMGDVGVLLALVVIILIDGTGFPTLPEVWMVFIFGVHQTSFGWGVVVVVIASLASLGGNFILYSVVKLAHPPRWIKKAMKKYTDFLVVHDERLLLLNRIAPIVPYTGAFMAVCEWNLKKCTTYLIIGALAKSSVVVVLAKLSYDNVRQEIAPWVAIGAVLIVLLASIIASFIYKKRVGLRGEKTRSP